MTKQHIGVCINCGESFSRSRPLRGSTCSPLCRAAIFRRKSLDKRICKHCGISFEILPSSKVTHCSIQCFNKSRPIRNPDMMRICQRCNKPYKRAAGNIDQKFCSLNCRIIPPIETECAHCRTVFIQRDNIRSVKFCSRSCAASKTAELRANASNKKLFCVRCGWNDFPGVLEYHHIDRNRKNNKPANIAVLCPTCHSIDHYLAKDGNYTPKKENGRFSSKKENYALHS